MLIEEHTSLRILHILLLGFMSYKLDGRSYKAESVRRQKVSLHIHRIRLGSLASRLASSACMYRRLHGPPRDGDTCNRIIIESTEICNNLLRHIGMCGIVNRPNERR
jgi:hypothetical protein